MRSVLSDSKTIVVLAAAVKLEELKELVSSSDVTMIRAVANVNVATCSGLTVILRKLNGGAEAFARAQQLFQALGQVVIAHSESDMDRLSVLSGCAPAITAIVLEGLQHFGILAGFDEQTASEVAAHCMRSSLHSMQSLGIDTGTFKYSVAAPGGIVQKLLDSGLSSRISTGVVEWLDQILQRITMKPSEGGYEERPW
jgi:pyrroline-5-carboxylate reductase